MSRALPVAACGVLALRLLACGAFGDSSGDPSPPSVVPDASVASVDASPALADAGPDVVPSGSFASNFDPPQSGTMPFGWSRSIVEDGGSLEVISAAPLSTPNVLRVTGTSGHSAMLLLDLPDGPSHMVLEAKVRIDALVSASGALATIAEVGCQCDPPSCTTGHDVRGEMKVRAQGGVTGKATDDTVADEHTIAATVPIAQSVPLVIDATSSPTANDYTMKLGNDSTTARASGTCTSGRRVQIGVRFSGTATDATFTVSYDDVTIRWD